MKLQKNQETQLIQKSKVINDKLTELTINRENQILNLILERENKR